MVLLRESSTLFRRASYVPPRTLPHAPTPQPLVFQAAAPCTQPATLYVPQARVRGHAAPNPNPTPYPTPNPTPNSSGACPRTRCTACVASTPWWTRWSRRARASNPHPHPHPRPDPNPNPSPHLIPNPNPNPNQEGEGVELRMEAGEASGPGGGTWPGLTSHSRAAAEAAEAAEVAILRARR